MTPRREVPAWLLSAILHFLLVLIAAWMMQPGTGGGSPEENERSVSVALVDRQRPEPEYLTRETIDPAGEVSNEGLASALPSLNEIREPLPDFLPADDDLDGIGAEIGEGLVGADGFLEGIAKGPKKGGDTGQTTTQVFGIQGTGTKFVYVFDRSGSMTDFGGKPLVAAKSQLIASLEVLGPNQQFQIVFYNDRPRAFTPGGGRPKLLYATEKNKKAARQFVAGMPGGGGTRHLPALKLAVDLGPDVVFFLTDAAEPIISERELKELDRFNRNAATIHAIEFGPGVAPAADNFLKKLARRNGGKYTYRDITGF